MRKDLDTVIWQPKLQRYTNFLAASSSYRHLRRHYQHYTGNKLYQTDLVFGLRSEFVSMSVHAGSQVHTRVAVMIYATLVDTQTHTETDSF